jgi:hypothetical protein
LIHSTLQQRKIDLAKQLNTVEFADLLQISKQTVSKAIKSGRLSKSVTRVENNYLIDAALGVQEFFQNARLDKDHTDRHHLPNQSTSRPSHEDVMPTSESIAMDRHYTALLSKLAYLEKAGTLISAEKYRIEAFQAARATRDAVLYTPQAISAEIKRQVRSFIADRFDEQQIDSYEYEIDDLVARIRIVMKDALTRALRDLADSRFTASATSAEDASTD